MEGRGKCQGEGRGRPLTSCAHTRLARRHMAISPDVDMARRHMGTCPLLMEEKANAKMRR